MIAKAYRALVAFKDTLVEAYVRGTADEAWGLRHPPKAGNPVCGLCGARPDDVEAAHARGVAEERKRWTVAIADERKDWLPNVDPHPSAASSRAALRNVLVRMGFGPA